jgi:probable phosphoglycerate mutase
VRNAAYGYPHGVTQDERWIGLIRHGQSIGNQARERAEASGSEVIDLADRDADVPLSDTGRQQAEAVGHLLAEQPPDVVLASSYRRALDTARIAIEVATGEGAEFPAAPIVDERLRDRELGVLDLLTSHGVRVRYPEEQARRHHLGKFYYRPPGGESWADVVLRLRSLLAELPLGRVLLFGHEMTFFCLRYLLEGIPEPELIRMAPQIQVPNGSITIWEPDDDRFRMTTAHSTDHLDRLGAQPTMDEDAAKRTA